MSFKLHTAEFRMFYNPKSPVLEQNKVTETKEVCIDGFRRLVRAHHSRGYWTCSTIGQCEYCDTYFEKDGGYCSDECMIEAEENARAARADFAANGMDYDQGGW